MRVREFQWSSLEASAWQRKHRHLRRRPMLRVHWSNWFEAHLITEASGSRFRPVRESGSGPFETVIAMAHFAGSEGWEQHVVLAVGSSDHHVPGPREFEQ